MRENGVVDRITEMLERRSIHAIVYDDIGPGVTTALLPEMVSFARASKAQVVVGVGGMRVLSAARTVAVAACPEVEIGDVIGGRVTVEKPTPYVEVPSSYRNHFMLRSECVLTGSTARQPVVVRLPPTTTRAVLIDPNLTLSLSPKYAAAAMMDTLLAAIEGYISVRSSFFSDTMLVHAVELLGRALRGITETPQEPRHRVVASEAGLLTAFALATSSQGVGGALAYSINSRYTIPKSWVATVLLPHIIDSSVHARPEKLKRVAEALGEDVDGMKPGDAAYQASASVRRIIGQLDLPGRLREMDLAIDELVDISEVASSLEMSASAPAPHTASDLYDIIKQAF
jgi:alcohol dehydrogenase